MNQIIENIFNKNFFYYLKNNRFYIIIFFILLIIAILGTQFYFFQKNKKELELSILYEQAFSDINNEIIIANLQEISKEKGIFGILSTLQIIKNKLEKNNYDETYNLYIDLLNHKDISSVYQSIIAIQASYNLIDHLGIRETQELLSYYDDSIEELLGYNYEILFLLSIKDNNKLDKEKFLKLILEDNKISNNIKSRVQKINEFEKHK